MVKLLSAILKIEQKLEIQMKYVIIGAGGIGGPIGACMTEAGNDVTLIARGAHGKAMAEKGIVMETTKRGTYLVTPVKVSSMEQYNEKADIIFVCVKGYSLQDTIPFIKKAAHEKTVVIPLLNIYGTGGRMQKELPELLVTDGCIYIAAEIKAPGHLWVKGDIFRVVYGVRRPEDYERLLRDGTVFDYRPILEQVKYDLQKSDIQPVYTENIRRDALQKFSYVSPAAACGQYYDANADQMQKPGEVRELFAALIGEIDTLAKAMGIPFETDVVKTNLDILDTLSPDASTSMQRDIRAGKNSEIDGLVYEVVRMGRQLGVSLPMYEKVAAKLRADGLT